MDSAKLSVEPREATAPHYGRRLLPATIDEIATHSPHRIWASLPYDDADLSKGYEDITYARFAGAINRLSWTITNAIGQSSAFETIAYYGAGDVRYFMMQMAAAKAGYKVLFSSPLNSEDTHITLLEKLGVETVFSASGVDINRLLGRHPAANIVIPDLDDLLTGSEDVQPYPFRKKFEEAQFDPYLILHTSGTTGTPKPVVRNHGMDAALDAHSLLPDVEGRPHALDWVDGRIGQRVLVPSPPYHVIAAHMAILRSVFGGAIYIPGFRHRVPQARDICNIIEHADAEAAILTPWIMEDIARLPDSVNYIRRFAKVVMGGASTSAFAIDKWSQHTSVQTIWGSTEITLPPVLVNRSDECEYIVFDPVYSGIDFRRVEGSDHIVDGRPVPLYRAILTLTTLSESTATWHKSHCITLASGPPYPELDTGDLFTPHPDAARAHYVWKFIGRTDDMVTFATGNNLYRADLERAFAGSELIRAALLVGAGHRQAVLLLELADGVFTEDATALWTSAVAPVNQWAPLQGVVAKTHLALVRSGGFIRTGKGSVIRRATESKFCKEITAIYENFGDLTISSRSPEP
ncbi:acetyl-CoA synthetase-like protein [Thozetella sp. PMI_491]|nr:acetyl-CoA synthetase-like protein [Thozetella sp. PMI_491]